MKILTRVAALAFATLLATPVLAYPERPVTVLVTIPPGGAPDIVARVLAEKLSGSLGQPVVVENRPGSNGNIAGEAVARAKPDGHTLILVADSLIVINPALYPKMSFDPFKDLAPVATVASNQFVLAVNPSLPVNTFQEFIEHARKAKPPLAYASGGNGSQHQLSMEMLKQRAGIDLLHAPYKGGAPAATATVSGETMAMFSGTSSAPQIKAGKLKALAVTGTKRSDIFPELPTVAEFYPGYEITIWLALFAPAGTPEPVLSQLRTEVNKALASDDVRTKLANAGGLDPYITTPEEFAALMQRDREKYGKLIKEVGITVD